jgi:hypothetical protein
MGASTMLRMMLCALLCPALVLAAPLPDKKAATEKYLEQLWAEMDSKDYVVALSAAYRMHHHAGKVDFLAKKLVPIRADKDDTIRNLKALDSDDEKLWKHALAELRYHSVGLTHGFREQLDFVTTVKGHERLLDANYAWWNYSATDTLSKPLTLNQKQPNGDEFLTLETKERGRTATHINMPERQH